MTSKKTSNIHWSWSLYVVLLVIRIAVSPFLPGYVHPDEFFQGGQELWFADRPTIPWEFEHENALRSVIAPTILSLLPLRFYSLLLARGPLSGVEIWIVPRIWCAILSVLAIDLPIWAMSSDKVDKRQTVPTAVLILASAWPTFVMSSRPFSNALETYFLSLLLYNVLGMGSMPITNGNCLAIGILCALGMFTRFTFVFFAFPIMLFLLYSIQQHGTMIALQKLSFITFAFVGLSIAIIIADTKFYNSTYPYLVITPWNALVYNSKVSNLKTHGLHPRWTHAVVNMLLLYGSMTILAYVAILKNFIFSPSPNGGTSVTKLSHMILVSGLGFLSLAPHQEPRFLLPIIVPIVLIASDQLKFIKVPKAKYIVTVWIIFNFVLLLLFGILHQSGVVKSLLKMGSTLLDKQPVSVIYFHTYMPPTFLLQQREETLCYKMGSSGTDVCQDEQEGQCGRVVDLKGSDLQTLKESLETQLSCSTASNETKPYVYLVTPPLYEMEDNLWSFSEKCNIPNHNCQLLWQHSNHLSTEDPPLLDGSLVNFYDGLVLNVFNITCPEKS